MRNEDIARQALAFAWATHLKFPAAEQLLEAWASEKICEPDAPLVELSEILNGFSEERQQALMRLARDAEVNQAACYLLACFNNGLEIEGSFDCTNVFYNLERFIRAFDKAGPLPRLPLGQVQTEPIFRSYSYGLADWEANWDSDPIRRSEACDAVVELLRAVEPKGTAEIVPGAPQCPP